MNDTINNQLVKQGAERHAADDATTQKSDLQNKMDRIFS
jgi:hypothetical protein